MPISINKVLPAINAELASSFEHPDVVVGDVAVWFTGFLESPIAFSLVGRAIATRPDYFYIDELATVPINESVTLDSLADTLSSEKDQAIGRLKDRLATLGAVSA